MGLGAYTHGEVQLSPNLPPFTRGDLLAVLIAIAISLINMAHVVGLLLFESVSYHGFGQSLFRTLSMVATPAAVLANLLITLLA